MLSLNQQGGYAGVCFVVPFRTDQCTLVLAFSTANPNLCPITTDGWIVSNGLVVETNLNFMKGNKSSSVPQSYYYYYYYYGWHAG
jgi:hypothetical protein